MYTRELFASRNDSRNSSYRVCKTFPPALWSFNDAHPQYTLLVDRNTHRVHAAEDNHILVHYDELLNIYILPLPASPLLKLKEPETLVLARTRPPCPIERLRYLHEAIPSYRTNSVGTIEVIDLSVLSAVVGCLIDGNETYILDCTWH